MAEKKSKLAVIKTKPTAESVEDFINKVPQEQKRKDGFILLEMMKKASGDEPVLWSSAIIGFGNKRYKSPATGREVDWFFIGFSPRKANLSLYLMMDQKKHTAEFEKLEDINLTVLEKMIKASLKQG